MSDNNTNNLISIIADRLITPDTNRIRRQQDHFIERAHAERGTERKSMVLSVTKPTPHILVHTQAADSSSTPVALPPLPEDVEALAGLVTDFQKTLRQYKTMRQTLVQLMRGVVDAQTLRNTLPEAVYALVREELPFDRTDEEACTLRGRERDLKQFAEARPLLMSYAMAGLILE